MLGGVTRMTSKFILAVTGMQQFDFPLSSLHCRNTFRGARRVISFADCGIDLEIRFS